MSSNTGFVNVSSAHFPTVITKDHNINGHINTVYIIHTATIEEDYNGINFVGKCFYDTNGCNCSCSFFARSSFCRHVILYRIHHNLPVVDVDVIEVKLLNNYSPISGDAELINPERRETERPPSPEIPIESNQELQCRGKLSKAARFNRAIDVRREFA